jgi:hypothetical protein
MAVVHAAATAAAHEADAAAAQSRTDDWTEQQRVTLGRRQSISLFLSVFVMLSVRKVGNGSEWATDSDLVMADSHTRERSLDSDSHSRNTFECNHLRAASPSHQHLPHT